MHHLNALSSSDLNRFGIICRLSTSSTVSTSSTKLAPQLGAALHVPSTLQVIQKRIHHFRPSIIGKADDFALNVAHQAFEVIAGVGDTDYAQGGPLPQVRRINFRDRDVEGISQPVFYAAQDLAFVFKGMRSFNAQFQSEIGDRHCFSIRKASQIG